MFDVFKKLFYNKKIKSKKQKNSKAEGTWVECQICGFKGNMEDFLQIDPNDTKCPKCQEDLQVFEV